MTLTIQLLGRFTVSVDGAEVEAQWRLRKAKTLVKLLALANGHHLHRDVVIDRLWPDAGIGPGANNFHQTLHAARRIIGADHVVLRDEMVSLAAGNGVSVDVDDFEAAAARALSSRRRDDLAAAARMWTGELLPEDLYEDWAAPHRDRLNAARVKVVTELAAVLLSEERTEDAVAVIEPVAAERPLDEEVHRALLTALAAAGRRWDAAGAFDRLRAELSESYGAEPEPETTAVFRRLFVGGGADRGAGPHNLPTLSTSFVGRHRELTELTHLLGRTRLLTLTGPGGAGKTRLAIELAHRQVSNRQHPDGVWMVELAGVTDESGVASAVATTLNLELGSDVDRIGRLVEQLADRRLLLVLDNCEHVLPAVAPLTTALLARCPHVEVVTTSREPVGHAAEVAWRVPSLELPGGDLDDFPDQLGRLASVQLFVERARSASPRFQLDATTAPAVAELCRRLDGMPLALELAAARVAHLSVAQVNGRLSDALTLLTRTGHVPLDRQRTLAGTLDWSHELLLDEERVVFRRLAVFRGGFDLDSAEAVCAVQNVIGVLARLVDKSLVTADTSGPVARYRLLEVVRQYAESHLRAVGEVEASQARHRQWYAGEASARDPDRGVPVVLEPPPWFDAEQDNLRAALWSAVETDPGTAVQLAASTWRFLLSRGQLAECAAWLSSALAACRQDSEERVRALFATGVLQVRQGQLDAISRTAADLTDVSGRLGSDAAVAAALDQQAIFALMAHDWPAARRLASEAQDHAPSDPAITACVGHFEAVLAMALGRVDPARRHLQRAMAAVDRVPDDSPPFFTALTVCCVVDDRGSVPHFVAEETMLSGRRVGAAQARAYLGVTAALAERCSGQFDEAIGLLDDCLKRFKALEDPYGFSFAMNQRAHTLRWSGDLDAACTCFDEAEAVRRSLRDPRGIALSLAGRAHVAVLLGDGPGARAQAREAVAMVRQTGDQAGIAITQNTAAIVDLHLGAPEPALVALEESAALAERVTPLHAIGWQRLLLAYVRHATGDSPGSASAAREAQARFETLGDERGRRALQRACKGGAVTMPS